MSSSNSHPSALSTPSWLHTVEARDDRTHDMRDEVARLFVAHREEIQRYLAHVYGSAGEAEELTQEVFLRLYRERLAGRRLDVPRAWLFRVARNLAIDHRRRGRQQMRLIDCRSVLPDTVIDEAPNGEETLLSANRRTALAGALGELTDLQRECLHLRASGLSLRDTGTIVGLSVAGVSDAVRRAIKRIRREIDGQA